MPASQWEPVGSVHTFQDVKTGAIVRMIFDGESLRPVERNLPEIEAEIVASLAVARVAVFSVATRLVREVRTLAAAGADEAEVNRLKRRIYVELLNMDPAVLR